MFVTHLQAGESWDRFLPKFKKRNVQRKKPAVVREKKAYTPFQARFAAGIWGEFWKRVTGASEDHLESGKTAVKEREVWLNLAVECTTKAVKVDLGEGICCWV